MEEILNNSAIISILQIIAIDLVLGGDNAIVIALACKNLPEKQRKLGIFYGALGAIVLRVIMVFFASALLLISGLKIIGGILLFWIGIKLILDSKKENTLNINQGNNLFEAIKTIIIADFVMSLDNSVAIAGAADGNIYLVIFGLLLSVPIIIWGSNIILKLIDKYPIIIYLGSALLGWIAGDMIQTDIFTTTYFEANEFLKYFPFIGSLFVILYSFIFKFLKK
ncbi:MAG: TerC family protein [Gammaproteobacteria bacterium]|tara:strand:- start:779 stop:1450 length:672 start_codon:yes stop_codon:yes gene_type:complete